MVHYLPIIDDFNGYRRLLIALEFSSSFQDSDNYSTYAPTVGFQKERRKETNTGLKTTDSIFKSARQIA
jgi:hypothetical protein